MASTHVALTGLQAFWPDERSIWLVSPSCIPKPAGVGEAVQGVLPFPWTHADLPGVHAQLQARYDSVLSFLADRLNELHGVDRSRSYWHLLVGPWVFSFVNLVTHHHATLELAKATLGEVDTIGLREESFITPGTPLEFLYEASDDLYNHQLYTRIATAMGVRITEHRRVGAETRLSESENPENLPRHRRPIGRRVLARLRHEADKWTEPVLASRADVLFRRSRLPNEFERRLTRATRGRIWVHRGAAYDPRRTLAHHDTDRAMRSGLDGYAGDDAAGSLVGLLLAQELPTVFVEDYENLVSYAERAYGRHEPRVILSTVAWHYDVAFSHFAGTRSEEGALLVGGQESGIFGVEANCQVESYERTLTDRYLTWGWTDPADSGCIPSTATRLVDLQERPRSEARDGILYVGTVALRFPVIVRPDFSNYFEIQRRFFAAVEPALRREFRVRLHAADFGWGVQQRLTTAFPDLNIERWGCPFRTSLRASRLYVCDHLSTTFTEALASNIPTIIFWDPVFFEVRESARPHFDRLRKVNVVHDSPESAARWIERVYPEVDEWWYDSATQDAVRAFRHEFARTSATPLKDWSLLLQELIMASCSRDSRSKAVPA